VTRKYVQTQRFDEGAIVRITLNRPDARNAQNRGMLVELGAAFDEAEADDAVRVIILAGAGPLFTAGHDLGSRVDIAERTPGSDQHPTFTSHGATRSGAEKRMLQEWHFYFQNTLRWRNLRKITIAQVQGTVYAAGLMLMWCCDLIVAAEGARFADVVGTRLGMCGIEYFAHRARLRSLCLPETASARRKPTSWEWSQRSFRTPSWKNGPWNSRGVSQPCRRWLHC
jgi:enoyl-CoA hydratase